MKSVLGGGEKGFDLSLEGEVEGLSREIPDDVGQVTAPERRKSFLISEKCLPKKFDYPLQVKITVGALFCTLKTSKIVQKESLQETSNSRIPVLTH